jgi:hypothetical protein
MGYAGGTTILFVLLMASLGIWYRSAGSVNTVATPGIEMFYWVTILFSQTLGTALGDWTADTNGFGYGGGALVFVAGLALLLALYFFTKVSRTLLFWSAFILTRPLGATVGDLLDKPTAEGGLALSRFYASGIPVALHPRLHPDVTAKGGRASRRACGTLLRIGASLAAARHRDTEQEGHKQARERCFAGNGADGGQRLSGLPRGSDGLAEPIHRGLQRRGDFSDGVGHIGGGIDGALRHAGLGNRLRCFGAHVPFPSRGADRCNDEAATFGYPRVRSVEQRVKDLWLSATGAVLNGG